MLLDARFFVLFGRAFICWTRVFVLDARLFFVVGRALILCWTRVYLLLGAHFVVGRALLSVSARFFVGAGRALLCLDARCVSVGRFLFMFGWERVYLWL